MKEYWFQLDINPSDISTAQQKGERVIGRFVQHYIKPKVRKSNEAILGAILKCGRDKLGITTTQVMKKDGKHTQEKFAYQLPEKLPLSVEVAYYFPFRKGTPKKVQAMQIVPMVDRPDVDNLTKSLLDQLTASGFIADDSQVYQCCMRKYRVAPEDVGIDLFVRCESLG